MPGVEQERLDQAPNTGGALDVERHREESGSSVGDVSRERTASVLFAETRATSSNPTMPQADLPEMWGKRTPHKGMYL